MAKKTAAPAPIDAPASGLEPSAPGTNAPAPAAAPAARTREVKPKLYIVIDERANPQVEVPVKARTKAGAIAFVAEATYKARLASMDEILAMGQKGVEVFDATKAPE